MIPLLIFFIRRFILRRKNKTSELFADALRKENNGNFLVARTTYETALVELNKTAFNRGNLKTRIIEKLKVLNTVIADKNSFNRAGSAYD